MSSDRERRRKELTAVYDVTARETFDELLKWFKEIDTYCGERIVKIVVGNKVDKVSLRLVT